jgi:hypothetical protein
MRIFFLGAFYRKRGRLGTSRAGDPEQGGRVHPHGCLAKKCKAAEQKFARREVAEQNFPRRPSKNLQGGEAKNCEVGGPRGSKQKNKDADFFPRLRRFFFFLAENAVDWVLPGQEMQSRAAEYIPMAAWQKNVRRPSKNLWDARWPCKTSQGGRAKICKAAEQKIVRRPSKKL